MKSRLSLSLAAIFFASLGRASPACRCLSNQPCWPSASEFKILASQVSQPLIKPIPPASACYPLSNPSGNCTEVLAHLDDGPWRSNLPGAMEAINFETFTFDNGTIDACYYNSTLGFPCDQGNIPIIGVDARTVCDVQAAVKFASKRNLRLVIKNTGHDYLGRSMARGGFMLWTHNIKNITYNANFIPDGAPSNGKAYKALTLGAGVQWFEAYSAANDNGRVIVGGISSGGSVGAAGGWIQGGGHSALSPKYGLGVDNVIQFTVVLASGEYVTANEYQHKDLFWALRGGGGGTYGVVITATYQTHDVLPFTVVNVNVSFATPEIAQNVTTEYFSILPALSDAGWGGYSFVDPTGAGLITLAIVSNESLAQGNETWSSFINRAKSIVSNPQDVASVNFAFPSFFAAYMTIFPKTGQVGHATELFSRLISRDIALQHPEKIAKVALGIPGLELNFVAGGAVSKVDPDSTGLNPAWREAVGMFVTGIGSWSEGTSSADINRLRQAAQNDLASLDTISPNSGTYFNEAFLFEKDFKKTFFGAHYSSLKGIKRKYDKHDLFIVAEGVGSDDWDKSLNCRLN